MVSIFWGHLIPINLKQVFYSIALIIKSLLVCLLPLIVYFLLSHSLNRLSSNAILLMVMMLVFIVISNFFAINLGYFLGSLGDTIVDFKPFDVTNIHPLVPLWDFRFPSYASPFWPIFAALITTLCLIFRPSLYLSKLLERGYLLTNKFVSYFFTPLIPVMIFGFSLNFQHMGVLSINNPALIQIWGFVITSQLCYILALYLAVAHGRIFTALNYLKNMLAAILTGFGTASSAVAMPVTIECSIKNLGGSSLPRIIIPASSSIHSPGSALGITILCLFILKIFGYQLLSYQDFITFAALFTIAKFSVAGIPSGVALVISPLLISHLSYSDGMIDFLLAIYVFFDPFGTAANVSANGAFAIFLSKHYKKTEIKL